MIRLEPPHPVRKPDCPAPAELETHLAGEQGLRLEPHLFACSECRRYVEALERERDEFVRSRPPEAFLRQLGRQKSLASRQRWWPWLLAPAVTAVLVLVVAPSGEVRGKGGLLSVHYLRPGMAGPSQVTQGQPLRAKDSLLFTVSPPSSGYLLILDVDGSGAVTVFHPYQGSQGARIEAGVQVLRGSIELDDAPGPEWLIAVFSRSPLEVSALEVRPTPHGPPDLICPGCQVDRLRIEKAQ